MTKLVAFIFIISAGIVAVASAETPEQRQACQNDAFRLCQQLIPDRERVFACLVEYRESLSGLCHAAIDEAVPPPPPPVAAVPRRGKPKAKVAAKPQPKTSTLAKNSKNAPVSLAPPQ